MDSDRLDLFARWIGASNRRQVIGSALAGAAAALGGSAIAVTVAKRNVTVEGPCGNGSVKDNRCRRNTQCCTGFCDKKKGKKPYGRCRCRKLNQRCQEDRNCCATAGQPMTCVNGACQTTATTCVPLGGVCTSGGNPCCTDVGAAATCTSSICRDPDYCATVLAGAGCTFVAGPDAWDCNAKNLTGVNLSGCLLVNAGFYTTNLTNALMVSTDLTDANFVNSNVTGVEWNNTTCPTGVNSDANGETCCNEFTFGQVPTGCPSG